MDGSGPRSAGVGTADPAGQPRDLRDWFVDGCLFVFAVAYGVLWSVWLADDPTVADSTLLAHQVIAAVSCAALWLRRRWPVGVALFVLPLATYADLATGAQLVALFTVAARRSVVVSAAVCAATVLARSGLLVLHAGSDEPIDELIAFSVTTNLAVLGWGMMVRHRRQLVASLRDRAERAETEALLRAERTQQRARTEIAREMHDVLGHRLSLLSVHAGALEYRPDAPADEVASAAAVIRASAHQALQDLREVIGVLRAPVGELPQPTFADLPELVDESVRAGMRVDLRIEVDDPPEHLGRTAYRVVREGLTNAHKHAPGATVTVTVSGGVAHGLTVELVNPVDPVDSVDPGGAGSPGNPVRAGGRPAGRVASPAPESGQGLIGLTERVELAGGRLSHGHTDSGGFRLLAWLPWPP